MKTLSILLTEQTTIKFEGKGFQPLDLGEDISYNSKIYSFGIPFSYFLDVSKKRKVIFTIKQSALELLPHIRLLEVPKSLSGGYDTVLELARSYRKHGIRNIVLKNINVFIRDGYLIEKKPEIVSPSLNSVYGEDVTFEDLLSGKTSLIKRNPSLVDIKVISREDVNTARIALGISNVATQTLPELKGIVKRLGLLSNVRELTSNQARTYYLRLITDYTSKKMTVGRDLTKEEKDEIISNTNAFIDSIASLVTRL